jgi:hypothetical protein
MISDDDCRRVVSLYETMQRGFKEGASEGVRNEGEIAFTKLRALLTQHELDLNDIPAIAERHRRNEAAKDAKKAASASSASRASTAAAPNALQLVHHVTQEWGDMQEHERIAYALWVLHAHVYDRFEVSPRLALLSPVRGCGKTNLLKLAERLIPNATRYANISAASLFRVIDQGMSTCLLDEGDNAGLKIDRILRSVLNDGYERGGVISRSPGGIRRDYSIYAPVAIGAIGTLTLPLLQRSIVINMQRSRRTDLKTKEMFSMPEEINRLAGVQRQIVAWAQSISAFDKNPRLPKALQGHGRICDNWRVLISIADSFGSDYWSEIARDAATLFSEGYHDEDAPVALLIDIHTIFIRLLIDRIKSHELIQELHQLEDGMGIWSAWCGENDDQAPHAISQGEVAALLKRFHRTQLRPRTLFAQIGPHEARGKAGRGYYYSQFEPWWKIYYPKYDKDAEADNVRQLLPKASKAE